MNSTPARPTFRSSSSISRVFLGLLTIISSSSLNTADGAVTTRAQPRSRGRGRHLRSLKGQKVDDDDTDFWIDGLHDEGPGTILSQQACQDTVTSLDARENQQSQGLVAAADLPVVLDMTDDAFLRLDSYIELALLDWLDFSYGLAWTDPTNVDQVSGEWRVTIDWYQCFTAYFPDSTDPMMDPAELEEFNNLLDNQSITDIVAVNKLEALVDNMASLKNVRIQLTNGANYWYQSDNAQSNVMNFLDMICGDAIELAAEHAAAASRTSIIASDIDRALGFDVDGLGHFYVPCTNELPEVTNECASVLENLATELIMSGKTLYVQYGTWNMGVIFLRDMWSQVPTPQQSSVGDIQTLQVKALARSIDEDQIPAESVDDMREMLDKILSGLVERYDGDFYAAVEGTLVNQELLAVAGY